MESQKNSVAFKFGLVDPEIRVDVPSWAESDTRGKQFVCYGPDNKFPNKLFELVQQSPTASSVISGTVELMKGYELKNNFSLPCLPYINNQHDTIDSLVENLVRDYIMFGAIAIQVIYNKLDQIAELYHIPFEFIRMNEDKDCIYFNKKWGKYSTNSIQYHSFTGNVEDGTSQIYVYTNSGRRQTYGMSMFNPALDDIVSEAIASKYIKNSLESGLAARFVIDLPNSANLTDDQKSEIEDGIRKKFCGVSNAGEFLLYFNNGADALNVNKIDSDDSHEVFNAIRTAAKNSIFVCLHAVPNLFGDATQTTGFNSQEYDEAFKLYEKMTLNPIKNVIRNAFETIFGNEDAIEFITPEPETTIENETPAE